MISGSTIAEALPSCLPLPRTLQIGDQSWTLAVSAVLGAAEGRCSVRLLLRGPYNRQRRARLEVEEEALLSGAYDARRAVEALMAWLPYSDEDDVLDLAARDLTRLR